MNILRTFLALLIFNLGLNAQKDIYDKADDFFKKHVTNGLVAYQSIQQKDSNTLAQLIAEFESVAQKNRHERKPALINLYNLGVLRRVLQNYPLASPLSVSNFFDVKDLNVNGKTISLNELENEVIRPEFGDARIHFALVCAAVSCPKLQSFAYRPEFLESQLNQVTSEALQNPLIVQLDSTSNKVAVSAIFNWYKVEFENTNKGILQFLNQHGLLVDLNASVKFLEYDWTINDKAQFEGISMHDPQKSNVQAFTPSVTLPHKVSEVILFNNLYTQTAYRDANMQRISAGERQSWNTLTMTYNYGVTKSGRFNIGLDLTLRSTTRDAIDSNPFNIYQFKSDPNNRTALSSIAPKIKFNPYVKWPKFSVQSALYIPVAKDLEANPWLDYNRYTSWTQFFLDKPLGAHWQLFLEADLMMRFRKDFSNENNDLMQLSTPLSAFLSYFATPKSTVYAQYQYAPFFTSFPDFYMQGGLGYKYQVLPKMALELLTSNFFASRNQGAGVTYNLGLRFIN